MIRRKPFSDVHHLSHSVGVRGLQPSLLTLSTVSLSWREKQLGGNVERYLTERCRNKCPVSSTKLQEVKESLCFPLVHILTDLDNLRDAASEVHSSIYTHSSLYCCVGTVELGVGLLQERGPELVGCVGPEINQLSISKLISHLTLSKR